MAYRNYLRRRLLAANLPESNAVREELRDYLTRTGLVYPDFARRIGYSAVSLRFFLAGTYERVAADDTAIRYAIREFIHAHPIGPQIDSQGGRLYDTENARLLRKYFDAALDAARAYYIYGPPGTQKTFSVQRLIAELNQREIAKKGVGQRAFYVYARHGIGPVDLMKRLAKAAGIPGTGGADRILDNFRFDFRGRRVLVVFDEAHHLNIACLETIRELIDLPPHAGLLFLGSHNLKQIFQQVELEQWRSRLHAGKPLPGVSESEAREIIAGELGAHHSATKVSRLIESARVPDPRQGKDFTYISARKLFWSIRDTKVAVGPSVQNSPVLTIASDAAGHGKIDSDQALDPHAKQEGTPLARFCSCGCGGQLLKPDGTPDFSSRRRFFGSRCLRKDKAARQKGYISLVQVRRPRITLGENRI